MYRSLYIVLLSFFMLSLTTKSYAGYIEYQLEQDESEIIGLERMWKIDNQVKKKCKWLDWGVIPLQIALGGYLYSKISSSSDPYVRYFILDSFYRQEKNFGGLTFHLFSLSFIVFLAILSDVSLRDCLSIVFVKSMPYIIGALSDKLISQKITKPLRDSLILKELKILKDLENRKSIYKNSKFACSDCPLCWEKYKKGDMIKVLKCKHFYHLDCLAKCLRKICPMCNIDLQELALYPGSEELGKVVRINKQDKYFDAVEEFAEIQDDEIEKFSNALEYCIEEID